VIASSRRTPDETDSSLTNLDQADLARSPRVRAAAQLRRKTIRQLDHPHLVAVLLAEQRHGVVLVHGHVDGHVLDGLDLRVGQHLAVHDRLNLFQLLIGHLRKVRKVEAQPLRMHRRPGLLHMRAQHLPQRRVQQMRPRMIAPDRVAPLAIHDGAHVIADRQRLLEQSLVRAHALHRQHAALNLGDGRIPIRRGEPARIARLPARVAVKAGLIEHHLHQIARRAAGTPTPSFTIASTSAPVAVSACSPETPSSANRDKPGWPISGSRPSNCARAGLLLGAGGFEAFLIEDRRRHRGSIDHEIQRQTISLVEVESLSRRDAVEFRESDSSCFQIFETQTSFLK
jgi:hypothetical protein